MTDRPRILVVDDDPGVLAAYRKILQPAGGGSSALDAARAAIFADATGVATEPELELTTAGQGEAAIELVAAEQAAGRTFALAFVDMRMPPGIDGMTTAERLWELDPDLQVVIATAYSDCSWAELSARSGQTDRLLFLKKPFDPVEAQQLAATLGRKRQLLDAMRIRERELEARVAARTHELTAALQAAEAAGQAKLEFLANMSHEIRTPLTAILGFAELLQDSSITPAERAEHVEIIARSGDHLLSIVNNVLDVSKLAAGQVIIESLPTDLPAILSDVASALRVGAAQKGLRLELSYDGPCPQEIRTDPLRLRQILLNLVSNAIKFTDRGTVQIRVRTVKAADGTSRLRLAVADSGIGMTAAQVGALFRPFVQADSSTSRRYGGTGLGLSISRQLAVLMGGDITVASEEGRGTTFTVDLPIGVTDGAKTLLSASEAMVVESPGCAEERPSLRGHILLVEDAIQNQRLLTTILRRAGADVTLASDGDAAIELALGSRAAGRPFDLILMDMQMPIVDGYAATRQLRAAGWSGPIVALTAHSMQGDRERCVAEGCDGYETKPVRAARLVATCARFLPG